MIPARHFYMIRHGETEANQKQIMAGSADSPLTDLGRAQAEAARIVVENLEIKPAAIYHSHLSRARDTAEIINTTLQIPSYEDPDLAELHAGGLEGAPYSQCRPMLDGWTDPPGGETFEFFFERIARAKTKAFTAHPDKPVLIVCHGGVFRGFAKLYGLDIWGVRNCELHEFIPNPSTDFPWLAHRLEYSAGILKTPSESFHPDMAAFSSGPADKIA